MGKIGTNVQNRSLSKKYPIKSAFSASKNETVQNKKRSLFPVTKCPENPTRPLGSGLFCAIAKKTRFFAQTDPRVGGFRRIFQKCQIASCPRGCWAGSGAREQERGARNARSAESKGFSVAHQRGVFNFQTPVATYIKVFT